MDGHWCHRRRAAGPGRVGRAGARGQPTELSLDDGDECSCDALVGAVRCGGGVEDGDRVAGWKGGGGEGCGGGEGGLVASVAEQPIFRLSPEKMSFNLRVSVTHCLRAHSTHSYSNSNNLTQRPSCAP